MSQPPGPHVIADAQPPRDKTAAIVAMVVGVVVLLIERTLLVYLLSLVGLAEFTNTYSDTATGQPLAYPQTAFFWGDLGIVLFGLVSLVEGVALLITSSAPVARGLAGLMAVVALVNAYAFVNFLLYDFPIQILPLLAGGFATWTAITLWRLGSPQRRFATAHAAG